MPTVRVVDQITRAQDILQDVLGVRWPVLELQRWLNDSYRELVTLRPESSANIGTYACVEGAKQDITGSFPQAIALLDIVRNLTPGASNRAVQGVSRTTLDTQNPEWMNEDATNEIELFIRYAALPKLFFVYPPALAGASLEVVYSQVPQGHALTEAQLTNPATADVLNVDDQYANALVDYILYRAYSKDADSAANMTRAAAHYTAMRASLGVGG
jgi:hypothetical protein